MIGINIEASQRGKGYSEEALRLLAEYTFYKMNIDKIANKFPAMRTSAERVSSKIGFIRQNDDLLILTKDDFEEKTQLKSSPSSSMINPDAR
jgi:hypothetical protein